MFNFDLEFSIFDHLMKVICQKYLSFFILTLFFSIHSISWSQLNGNYTIGGSTPDYTTIQAAVTDLTNQGVSGNVNFKLRPGVYNEKITIGIIPGVSTASVVVFESETADSSDVWWTSSGTNDATNYTVKCNATRFIQFRNISFRTTGYGSGVFIISNGTSNLTIENCHLYKSTLPTVNYDRHIQIYSSNQVDSNLYMINNHFENAGYAVADYGQSATLRDSNIVISGNQIKSYRGILLDQVESCVIEQNTISATYFGVTINGFGNPLNINRNNIFAWDKALSIQQNSGNLSILAPLWITNNFLNGAKGAVDIQGGSGTTQIVNNSILNRYAGGNYYALNLNTPASVENNILANDDQGAALKIQNSVTVISDYNLMYTEGTYLVTNVSAGFITLQDWQANILHQDLHSWEASPNFISATDLHILSNSYLWNNGMPNSQIIDDIDGEPRVGAPDIGADEFVQPPIEAGLEAMYVETELYTCSGTKTIQTNIRNHGTSPLTSVTINWEVNGVLQTPVYWTGSIDYLATSEDIDLNFDLIQDEYSIVNVWISSPNGMVDPDPSNDSWVSDTVFTRMKGTYDIGGQNADYATIHQAVTDLLLRGTCENVVLSIANGTYSESVNFNSIDRFTVNDTLFIVSTSGNRDSVIWNHISSSNWSVVVGGTNNVIFKNLTFKFTIGAGSFVEGAIQVGGYIGLTPVSNFEFNNCVFYKVDSLSPSFTGINMHASNFRVKNCKFSGLWRAIDQDNASTQGTPVNGDIFIENNEFHNIAEYSFYVAALSNVYIRNNHFFSYWTTTPPPTVLMPLYLQYVHGDLIVEGNKFEGGFVRLLQLNYYNDTAGAKIRNNFFSCTYVNANAGEGLLALWSSSNVEIIHNSFNVVHGPNGTGLQTGTMGSFISEPMQDCTIKNNSFKADKAYQVYYGVYTSVSSNIGFNNVDVDYLAVGYDDAGTMQLPPNTTLFHPSYYSSADLHLSGSELAGSGTNLGLGYDIDGDARPNPPAIGADEMAPLDYDVKILNLYAVVGCYSVKFMLDLYNIGAMEVDSLLINVTCGSVTESILLPDTLHSFELVDSIVLLTLPMTFDSTYNLTADVILSGNTDGNPYNNHENEVFNFPMSPLPYLGFDHLICFGNDDHISLQSSTYYSNISWNSGMETGTYTIEALAGQNVVNVTDIYGCEYSDTIMVTYDPDPQLQITFENDTLFANILNASWLLNGSLVDEHINYFVPTVNGSYYYMWMSPNGCGYLSPTYNYNSAGLSEQTEYEPIIFPNPFGNYFNVQFTDEQELVVLMDAQMKLIGGFANTNGKIDTTELPAGVYFVELKSTNGNTYVRKAIKTE